MSKDNGKNLDSDSHWEDLDSEKQAISASLSREEQLKLWKEKKVEVAVIFVHSPFLE
ncbi:hypothetical protein DSO57_1001925 [Entomophthora muscae]|uniref:Uncharacterized protein n=1 Tax=Entomophthora muscae TaxID=34485 RepID=A0ACC2UIS1_9FUNG|nr:hypothetical protein DSO57_1001925 [Entomophthora muscae]